MTQIIRAVFTAILVLCAIPQAMNAEPTVSSVSTPYADLIMVYKSSHKMVLFNNSVPIGDYRIELGNAPEGDKVRFGDGRTPEGTYYIDRRNPNSAYHLSLGISYPNEEDVAEAEALGVDPGGDIFIHGGPTRFWDRFKGDWTAGCISVTNREMEEIWAMVPTGTPIIILP